MGLRIVLTSFGSLGDLHPYIALGRALAERGHRPVLALPAAYESAIRAAGLEHRPVRPDVDPSRREIVRKVMDPLRGARFLIGELLVPHVRDSLADLEAACEGADLVVSHPLTFAAPLAAEKRGIPWVSSVLAPIGFFSRLDPPLVAVHPLVSSLKRRWPGVYRTLLSLAKKSTGSWARPVRELRRELGLPDRGDPIQEGQFSDHGTLALFSRVLGTPQRDWPVNTVVTGALSFDASHGGLPEELQRFLDAGEAPLVFTLGSAAVAAQGARGFYEASLAAVRELGARAVFLVGHYDRHELAPRPGDRVLACDWAPHSELFPRSSVVVHQGGAGTLHTALASGRPMLVVPFAHDQGDNAERAAAHGCARVLFPQRLDARRLAEHLDTLRSDLGYRNSAARVAEVVRAENGGKAACELLERVAR